MREKAKQGYVTGGKLFDYDNLRIAKGQTERQSASPPARPLDGLWGQALGIGLH
jgi:hypothetical protein